MVFSRGRGVFVPRVMGSSQVAKKNPEPFDGSGSLFFGCPCPARYLTGCTLSLSPCLVRGLLPPGPDTPVTLKEKK